MGDAQERSFLGSSESDYYIEDFEVEPSSTSTGSQVHHTVDHVDEIEGDEILFEMPPKVSISLPATNKIDLYMFHVHEEGSQLFLFCKHMIKGKFCTVCIQITNPYYYLQFLPIPGHEFDIDEEVRLLAHVSGGSVVSTKMKTMKYAFGDPLIPRSAEYCCAVMSSKCCLAKIKQNGKHYSHVFGLTSTLSENFFMQRKINGPCWITITNAEKRQKISTISMFSIPTIDCVTTLSEGRPALLNIGTLAIRSMFKSHQIFMITLRVFHEWDIEKFTGTGMKHITFVCSNDEVTITEEAHSSDHLHIFKSEKYLLHAFAKAIDHYDLDIIASYGLVNVDIRLLLDRMRENGVENWWKIGRLKRNGLPKPVRLNPQMCLSGRIPCDLRSCCIDFMHAKSNDLSAAVQAQFGFERQQIDHFEVIDCLKNINDLNNLVRYNVRDTLFIAQLLNALEILQLCLQISQISGCPWARVILGQASPRCEALLLRHFFDNGYVLPERVLTNQRKEPAFPGGMVLQPKRGFYETIIVALDFYSLYPSIIVEYNLCFTTLDLTNPDPEKSRRNPNKGVLPKIMEELLEQRAKIKQSISDINDSLNQLEEQCKMLSERMEEVKTQMSLEGLLDDSCINDKKTKFTDVPQSDDIHARNEIGALFDRKFFVEKMSQFSRDPASMYSQINDKRKLLEKRKPVLELELQRLNLKQTAIKVLANAIYGYLGYRHSRFLGNSIAALIAQQGRYLLQRTVEIVEKSGRNTVVYGDTDSVMINSGTSNVSEALEIAREICETVSHGFKHIKLGIEAVFLKMLLVQKKRYVVLVYDGPDQMHQETKGIELIRRDWCGLTKYASAFILDQFLHSKNRDKAIENIISELSRVADMLHNGGQPLSSRVLNQSWSSEISTSTQQRSPTSVISTQNPLSPKILPVMGFPQMYGNTKLKPTPKGQDPINVEMKVLFPGRTENNAHDILRAYGICGRFTPDPKKPGNEERIKPIEKIDLEQLIIHMTLSKPLDKYQDRMTPHVAVARRMQERGENVGANMTIGFVIANAGGREVGENARIPDEIQSVSELDVNWYLANQIMAPIWRLCEPFGGMDVRMLARALGLTVSESEVPVQRDECVAIVIPHVTELRYPCAKCNADIEIPVQLRDHFTCQKCGFVHSWKLTANRVTRVIRQFFSRVKLKCTDFVCHRESIQMPLGNLNCSRKKCNGTMQSAISCVNIYNTMRYFLSLYDKSNNREDIPYEPYRVYMRNVIQSFVRCHGFSNIQLATIFSEPSSVGSHSVSCRYSLL